MSGYCEHGFLLGNCCPSSTADDRNDDLIALIEARRNDSAFMARLEKSIARNKPILDRLASDGGEQ